MFLAVAAMARAGEITVTLDTSVLIGSQAAPFYIGFQLADGSLTGDGTNAAVVSNIQFGGGAPFVGGCSATGYGAASGDLSSSITETDQTSSRSAIRHSIRAALLSFNVSYTNNLDPAGLPR